MTKFDISKTVGLFPTLNKKLILATTLVIVGVIALPKHKTIKTESQTRISLPLQVLNHELTRLEQQKKTTNITVPNIDYVITKGDTLSTIFSKFNLDLTTMYQILEADVNILALDTLMPGNELRFWINPTTQQLDKLELYFNPAEQVYFTRVDDNHFEYKQIRLKGDWIEQPIGGAIKGSFSSSAIRAGATSSEVYNIVHLLKNQINFSRDLHIGDSFQILRRSQFVEGKPTGDSEIAAVRIYREGKPIAIYLYTDGVYYTSDGGNLQKAFNRYPMHGHYRISSPFNPHRHHPVTGRIAPHNGVDFAMPTGTPVYSTGDGVVTLVINHRYAGKYVVIKHSSKYTTRYLHLSKFKVHKGQHVKRGQLIGLSGATGRVTGPHLHFEFKVNGVPQNPLTVKIPMAKKIAGSDRSKFNNIIAKYNKMLDKVKG